MHAFCVTVTVCPTNELTQCAVIVQVPAIDGQLALAAPPLPPLTPPLPLLVPPTEPPPADESSPELEPHAHSSNPKARKIFTLRTYKATGSGVHATCPSVPPKGFDGLKRGA